MKTIRNRFVKFVATAAIVGTLFASGSVARGEGGGVGGGKLPPPLPLVVTSDFVLYDNGLIYFYDGSTYYIN
jgi:hypothetical protein